MGKYDYSKISLKNVCFLLFVLAKNRRKITHTSTKGGGGGGAVEGEGPCRSVAEETLEISESFSSLMGGPIASLEEAMASLVCVSSLFSSMDGGGGVDGDGDEGMV